MQFSNVLGGTFTTLEPDPEPPVELEFSNVLGGTFTTSLTDLAITGATDYRHGAPCALTVQHVTGSYAVYWSPTADHAHAGAVQLAVTDADLTDGSGTIEVTADRGAVLYGTAGYLIIVDGADSASIERPLLLETHKRMVTLAELTPDTAERITAIPDLVEGDALIWFDVQGGDVDDVEVFDDGSFSAAQGVSSFAVEAYVASAGVYTHAETQTVQEPAEPEHHEGGSSAVVEVVASGVGQIQVAGGSSAAVEVEAEGLGSASVSGGSSATVEVDAKGQGSAAVSGGSSSIVEVIARGGGSPEQAEHYSGGSSATVEVVSLGGGLLGVSSGSSSVVEIRAQGAGRPEVSGGASATVEVIARGGGAGEVPDHYVGGSSAVVEIAAYAAGRAALSGGSRSVVEIVARGGGTLSQLRQPVIHTSFRSLSSTGRLEIVMLGRDNVIVGELLQDGQPPEPGAITRVQAHIAGQCFESPEVTLEGNIVTLRLGQSGLPRGTHRCELIVYDVNHTAGIVWDRFFVLVRRQVACGE